MRDDTRLRIRNSGVAGARRTQAEQSGVSVPYRVATSEERRFYRDVLYPLQDRILAIAGEYGDELVLTGGTALARCYFGHRYSDDIDLFSASSHAGELGRDLMNALERGGLRVETITANPGFLRAYVCDASVRIPVDVAPDQPRIEAALVSALGVHVHALRDIAANKIGAFENRSEAKDAVDLFYLARRFSWTQMFDDAERKRIPIAYEDLQHFLEQPLSGRALLAKPIDDGQFGSFVDNLRHEITEEIKKKVVEYRRLLPTLVADLLWDTPPESRTINEATRPVLARRAAQLPLPARTALLRALAAQPLPSGASLPMSSTL